MNRVLLRLLRSPFRRLIGSRICGLRFRGRVTGHVVELPVEYVRTGRRIVVLAGRGATKKWWRNFRTPHRADVLIDGAWRVATGSAILPGESGRDAAVASYRRAHPRTPADTSDPLVVIELDHALPDRERALWARWFRNVTFGECVGFAVPASVGAFTAHASNAATVPALVAAGAVEGALLGWFQARVLRDVLTGLPVARWVGVTAAAAAFAWLVGLLPAITGGWLSGLPPVVLIPLAGAGGVALLASIGTAQWTVLRDRVPDAGRWVWGTALSWLAALGVFVAVSTSLWQPGQAVVTVVLIGVLGGLLMAATVAALTGVLVVRLERARRWYAETFVPADAAGHADAELGGRSS